MGSLVNVSNRRGHSSLLDLTVVLCCGSRSPSEVSKPVRANPVICCKFSKPIPSQDTELQTVLTGELYTPGTEAIYLN